ncbi:hypothetical protein CLU79DRAFT_758785 [Phycomyces nitens]|nr:hypothetical protein CLU79DRAFT_758785 [Phycomyces nitens]
MATPWALGLPFLLLQNIVPLNNNENIVKGFIRWFSRANLYLYIFPLVICPSLINDKSPFCVFNNSSICSVRTRSFQLEIVMDHLLSNTLGNH